MADKQKFPSEVIDLPSKGKLYPKDSPLASGKLEIKYMILNIFTGGRTLNSI